MTSNRLVKMLLDDDYEDEYHLLAMTITEEEEMMNKNRSQHRSPWFYDQGHAVIQRDRVQGDDIFYRDYFAKKSTFGPRLFQRRFE